MKNILLLFVFCFIGLEAFSQQNNYKTKTEIIDFERLNAPSDIKTTVTNAGSNTDEQKQKVLLINVNSISENVNSQQQNVIVRAELSDNTNKVESNQKVSTNYINEVILKQQSTPSYIKATAELAE